jgi:hypothetical protein
MSEQNQVSFISSTHFFMNFATPSTLSPGAAEQLAPTPVSSAMPLHMTSIGLNAQQHCLVHVFIL